MPAVVARLLGAVLVVGGVAAPARAPLRPARVHEVFSFPALACWWAARRSGVPLVIRPHGSLEPYDMAHNHPWLKRLLRPALRRLLEDCAAVWLTAQRESANLAGLGAAPCTVVTALPVDAPSSPGDGAGFRASLGLTAQARIVLFLGRLDRKKGLIRLVEAVDRVRPRTRARCWSWPDPATRRSPRSCARGSPAWTTRRRCTWSGTSGAAQT